MSSALHVLHMWGSIVLQWTFHAPLLHLPQALRLCETIVLHNGLCEPHAIRMCGPTVFHIGLESHERSARTWPLWSTMAGLPTGTLPEGVFRSSSS